MMGTFTDVIIVTTNDPAVPTAAFNLTGLGFTAWFQLIKQA